MKVLFAMGSELKSKNVAEKYYEKYGEEIEYKNVFYFKALLDEIKANKTYDRIVINEDLEQFYVKNVEALDKFIFNNIDLLTDEIENSEIIFICSDRRTKQNDRFVERLFNIGVYNTLIGDERNVTALCDYIKNPMNKKEAKRHLNINPVVSNGSVSTSDDTVEEVQIMNILKYYDNIKGKTEEYIPAFDRIAEQYSRNQLKIIAYYLPMEVKNVVFQSDKYRYLATDENQTATQNSSKPNKTISSKPARKGLFGILKENKNKENVKKQPDVIVETRNQEQDRINAEREELEREHEEAMAKAKREAQELKQAEAQAKADYERQQAEVKLRAEQEAIERQQAEQEAREREQAELRAKAEQEAREREQAELRAKAEQEAREREQAELRAKAEQEAREKAQVSNQNSVENKKTDIEIDVMPSIENSQKKTNLEEKDNDIQFSSNDWFEKKQAELRASINQESSSNILFQKDNNEQNLITNQQIELKAKDEQEAKEREQAELKAKAAEQEAFARQQAELKAKAEQEAFARQQAELKAKAEQEAFARQQAELKAKAEQEAFARQQAELKAKAEQEAFARQQAELRAKTEQEAFARQQAEQRAKAELEAKKMAEQEKFESERRKLEEEKLALEEERKKLMERSAQMNTNVARTDYTSDAYALPKMDYKKMVVFVGANKSGTTFLVNAISHNLAASKVGVGVLDMSRDKSLYYIYNQDDKDLRKIAVECMQKLSEGIDLYIPAERNLKIYTTIPGPSADSRRAFKNRAIIDTVKNANNLVIVDADFSTPLEYYEKADEIYIIQDLDIIKMQETTLFLRELKNRNIDMGKIRVIINKYVKSLLTPKKLIQGLSYYNDPQMSFIDELLESKVQHFEVPFNVDNYAKYIDGVYNNKLDYKKYSPDFLSSIEAISACVFRRNVPVKKKRFFG